MAGLFLPLLHPEVLARWLFWSVPLFGVFFCSFACPFGTIQEWLGSAAKFLKIKRFKLPWRFQKYLQFSRYIFALMMVCGITFPFLNARFYFQDNLIHQMLSWSVVLVLGVFLGLSLFVDRPFCNYFCLKGAIDGLMSVVRLFGIRKNEQKCVHCFLCDQNCPMNIRVEKTNFVRHPNCIGCLKCVSACPKNCLSYQMAAFDKVFNGKKCRPKGH